MAKSSKPATTDAAAASAAVTEALADFQRMGLASMSWMNSDWPRKMNEMGSEAMAFVSERIKHDVEFQRCMMECRDIREFQQLQADFLQTAINQYTEETGKMLEMGADVVRSCLRQG